MKEISVKIAITACGPTADCTIDERLGRAYWILLYHLEEDAWSIIDNGENRNAPQGAGKLTAQALVRLGATHVLTGEVGPKAFRILKASGVRIYLGAAGSAAGALLTWQRGDLREAESPSEIGSPHCLMGGAPVTKTPAIITTTLGQSPLSGRNL
jgi:predicted Fe-Mo cluster-binding NifX family protein